MKSTNALLEDNIVLVEGRLSVREDDDVKVVANNIINFADAESLNARQENKSKEEQKLKILTLNIVEATEEQKQKLRGAIRYFTGDRNNMRVQIVDNEGVKPCGAIYLSNEILGEFEEILGKENVKLM